MLRAKHKFILTLAGACLLAWCMTAGGTLAQEKDPQEPEIAAKGMPRLANQPVAIVMGRVITFDEIQKTVEEWKKKYTNESEANLFWHARKERAQTVLIAETAKKFAENVRDQEIVQYGVHYMGMTETDALDNLEEVKEGFLVTMYLRGRLGLSYQLQGLAPDFADYIRVTPSEVRKAYHRYKTREVPPGKIRLGEYMFFNSKYDSPEKLRIDVEACREALDGQPVVEQELEELAFLWEGCKYSIREVPEEGECSFRQEIVRFARAGEEGEVSKALVLPQVSLVGYIIERVEQRVLTFEEHQEALYNNLLENKRKAAQNMIMRELMMQADYKPDDLFIPAQRSAQRPASGG